MHPEFKYIHSPEEGITIGYRINDDTRTVTFAEAFTNPKDTFSKAIGRKIVEGRIRKGGVTKTGNSRSVTVSLEACGGSTKYRDISEVLLKHARQRIETNLVIRDM